MKVTHNPSPNPALVDSTKEAQKTNSKGETRSNAIQSTAKDSGSVEISENARLMKKAEEIAKGAPENRADKIAALKKAIANGTYQVAADKLAEKILDEHLGSDFGKNNL